METDPFWEPSFTYLFFQEKQEPHFRHIDPNLNPCSVKQPSVNQTSPWISIGALQPQIQASLDRKNSHIKWLQVIFRHYRFAFHPKNGLRVLKLTLGSPWATIKRDALCPDPLVYLFIPLCSITLHYITFHWSISSPCGYECETCPISLIRDLYTVIS
jgi:hypothetical protein